MLLAFGQAVRELRKARGFSQEGFGDACGIDRSYMGGIERGEHNLALINIMKIVQALELKPSEFFAALDGALSLSAQGDDAQIMEGEVFHYPSAGSRKGQTYSVHEPKAPKWPQQKIAIKKRAD